MINWTNVTVKLSSLKPWAHNPRTMSKRQAQRLLKSWRDLGQFQTIAIGPDCEVYDGHQRLNALLTVYGAGYEVAARQSDRPLDDDERGHLMAAANIAAGAWDWDKLAALDAEALKSWGFDDEALRQWNADAANLATMLQAEQPQDDAEMLGENGFEYESKYAVTIECDGEQGQKETYETLTMMGYKCRVVVV